MFPGQPLPNTPRPVSQDPQLLAIARARQRRPGQPPPGQPPVAQGPAQGPATSAPTQTAGSAFAARQAAINALPSTNMSPAGAGSAPPAGIQAAAGQVTGKPPPPAPAAAPPAGNDRQTALARLQQQQADEYAAQQKALAASKAQQLAQSSAASDFGGFGLSGASAGIRSQVANNADQNATLTLGKLRGQQEDETGQAINRQAALDALEGSENLDVDGDGYINGKPVGGKIGDGNPDDFAQAQAGSTTAINADGTKSTQAVALDAPIDDAHRQNLGSGYDMSHIKDGTFSKGSKYFASDSTYDYYQDASGAFYRVAR